VSKIIPSDKAKEHKIEKFSFGTVSKKDEVEKLESGISIFAKKEKISQAKELEKTPDKDYEDLLKKIDALTEEVVSLQMQLEKQEKEHAQELIKVKDESYEQGVKDAQKAQQDEIENLKVQYISSVTALQELELEIKEKLNSFEEELIETSIIIATKVIKKEVEENSSKIAKSIANYLLDDIKEDTEVKLLVNPKDYDELLKDSLRENIKVVWLITLSKRAG